MDAASRFAATSRSPVCSIRLTSGLWPNRSTTVVGRMRKALIVQGNPTTTGGVVIGGSAFGMTDNGRPFALYGDEATCGNCKGAFKIFGTATGRCYDGRAGVIEGDLVLCPCGRNRVLAGSDPGCYYEDDSTAIASRTTA